MRLPDGTIRKLRRNWNEVGHAHELTFCCRHRLPLLSKDRSRRWLIEALAAAREVHDVELWAYVIMPEHVHVLLWPRHPNYDVALIRKTIKQSVARRAIGYLRANAPQWLERLLVVERGRRFHRFWEAGGGYDRNVEREEAAWIVVEYIHANPVRRGLVATPTEWPWSSARWYAGEPEVLLAMDGCPTGPADH